MTTISIIEGHENKRWILTKPFQASITSSTINKSLQTFDHVPWSCVVNSLIISMNVTFQDCLLISSIVCLVRETVDVHENLSRNPATVCWSLPRKNFVQTCSILASSQIWYSQSFYVVSWSRDECGISMLFDVLTQ
jgi:hypothetical protein